MVTDSIGEAQPGPYERQLRALGRILDKHRTAKEICVLENGDGFLVHMLIATNAYAGVAYAPTTTLVRPADLRYVMADQEAPPPEPQRKTTGSLRWLTGR